MRSNESAQLLKYSFTSLFSRWPEVDGSFALLQVLAKLSLRSLNILRSLSTKTTFLAPRLKASSP